MIEWTPFAISFLAFCAMTGVVFVAGQSYLRAERLRRRLPLPQDASRAGQTGGNVGRLVAKHFDEKRFGVDDSLRGKLRLNLVRAGYLRNDAINFSVFWRIVA